MEKPMLKGIAIVRNFHFFKLKKFRYFFAFAFAKVPK